MTSETHEIEGDGPGLYEALDGEASLDWIPKWARDDHVVTSALKVVEIYDVDAAAACVVGPALLATFKANIALWSCFVILPWIAWATARCPDDSGIAEYDSRIWIIFIFVLVIAFYFEYCAARVVLPIQVLATGPFKILGKQVPFILYMVIALLLSVLMHMDLATNSLFLAKLLKTHQCNEDAFNVWHVVMQHSCLRFAAGVDIVTVAVFFWSLMLAQPVYALAATIPRGHDNMHPGQPVNYDIHDKREDSVRYHTLFSEWDQDCDRDHGDLYPFPAEAARMMTVTFQEFSYRKIVSASYSATGLHKIFATSMLKFAAFNFLENALQPNLQVSVLAVGVAAGTHRSPDRQIAMSIVLSLCTAMRALLVDSFRAFQQWTMAQNKLSEDIEYTKSVPSWEHFQCEMTFESEEEFNNKLAEVAEARGIAVDFLLNFGCLQFYLTDADGLMIEHFGGTDLDNIKFPVTCKVTAESKSDSLFVRTSTAVQRRLYISLIVFVILATLQFCCIAYAALKLYMAHVCDDGVWNARFPLSAGCVTTSGLMSE